MQTQILQFRMYPEADHWKVYIQRADNKEWVSKTFDGSLSLAEIFRLIFDVDMAWPTWSSCPAPKS